MVKTVHRILYIAEITGKSGIQCVKNLLPKLKKDYDCSLVIANGDSATNGAGLGKNHAGYLRKLGVDVLTGGDFSFFKKDMVDGFAAMPYVLRPANLPVESPGRGWRLIGEKNSSRIAVVSLLGQSGFTRIHGDNPFARLDYLLERIKTETSLIVVDFHGATTAEKKAFGFFADGKVSAVIGSHGKVQTTDQVLLPGGTAYITDAGRTGCINTVGGCQSQSRIAEYISGIPDWTKEAEMTKENRPEIQGLVLCLGDDGKALNIERFSRKLEL